MLGLRRRAEVVGEIGVELPSDFRERLVELSSVALSLIEIFTVTKSPTCVAARVAEEIGTGILPERIALPVDVTRRPVGWRPARSAGRSPAPIGVSAGSLPISPG